MQYIRSIDKPVASGSGCFLCDAAGCNDDPEQRRQRVVLWTTPLSIVVMNLYPYTNGHLLVAPRLHKAELEELTPDEMLDMQRQTAVGVKLLKRAVSAQGFNIGINIGRCAGAGLPGHIHQHIVPRWSGDMNFMDVLGEVRIVPQAMSQLYDELLEQLKKLDC